MGMRMKVVICAVIGLSLIAVGCKKKVVVAVPPPKPQVEQPKGVAVFTPAPAKPPAAQAPRIESFTAEPASIERGQAATLRWTVSGTNPEVVLDPGQGIVQATGNRQVAPSATTTYTLTARNAIGMDTRSVTLDVRSPPAPPKQTAMPSEIPSTTLAREAKDIYFDYDMAELREDAKVALNEDAALLRRLFALDASFNVVIEGHADERGSAEYNFGLGDRRAIIARDYLVNLGVPANRLRTISFGEERPACVEANEDCYQRNRRAHLAPGQ